MPKDWKKEFARDTLALGSIPFCIIVLARSTLGRYPVFVYQLLIAFLALFIMSRIIKDSNMHIARAFILVVFTSVFYKAVIYTAFAALLWVVMLFSLVYLKVKNKEITKGMWLGIISVLVSAYISNSFL